MKAYNGYKQCTKCECVYPISCFYSSKGTSDGLRSWCRFCYIDAFARYYYEHKIEYMKRKERLIDKKLCSMCGKEPIAFYRSFTRCERCLNLHNIRENIRRAKLTSVGLCRECGVKPLYSRHRCYDCLKKDTILRLKEMEITHFW